MARGEITRVYQRRSKYPARESKIPEQRDRASPNQNTRAAHDISSINCQLAGNFSPRGVAAKRARDVEPGERERRNSRAPPLQRERLTKNARAKENDGRASLRLVTVLL